MIELTRKECYYIIKRLDFGKEVIDLYGKNHTLLSNKLLNDVTLIALDSLSLKDVKNYPKKHIIMLIKGCVQAICNGEGINAGLAIGFKEIYRDEQESKECQS